MPPHPAPASMCNVSTWAGQCSEVLRSTKNISQISRGQKKYELLLAAPESQHSQHHRERRGPRDTEERLPSCINISDLSLKLSLSLL